MIPQLMSGRSRSIQGRWLAAVTALAAVLVAAPATADPADEAPGWDIEVGADAVERGGSIDVTGSCTTADDVTIEVFHRTSFLPGDDAFIDARSLGQPLFRLAPVALATDADTGSFNGTITVPDGAVPGEYWVQGVCEGDRIPEWGVMFRVTGSDPRPTFDDLVGQSQHLDAIRSFAAAGVTRGCRPGRFCPTDDITRAQFASLLHRLLVDDLEGARDGFDDVASGSTHGRAVEELGGAGIIRGCADASFCPDDPIRRDQAATLVARALDLPAPEQRPRFQDVPAGSVHADAVVAVDDQRIMRGCRGEHFCPDQPLTRAQAASTLARGFGQYVNGE